MKPPAKGRAGRKCNTCQHPQRTEIDRRLARRGESGESILAIARFFGLKRDALTAHQVSHLPQPLAVVAARHAELVQETRELDVMASLGKAASRADTMLDACDSWLRDPEDPRRYTLVPRSTEVDVVWLDGAVKRKEKLGRILERVEQVANGYVSREAVTKALDAAGIEGEDRHEIEFMLQLKENHPPLPARFQVELLETKTADPRKLLLDAVATLKPVVELLGKASGALKPDAPGVQIVNLTQHPDYLRMLEILMTVRREFPQTAPRLTELMGGRR